MYEFNDTIVAVSSPTSSQRVIVRISGPDTIDILQQIFTPPIAAEKNIIITGRVMIDEQLKADAQLYLFIAPHSYTGETLAEIHLYTNPSVTEALLQNLLSNGLRTAGPGEFTARGFLNGKMDLTQAESVNEVIVSSNRLQLAAAEKLLTGKLAQTAEKIRSQLMGCITLIEAGLDFSGEDIEFINRDEAIEKLSQIKNQLEQLLAGSIRCESMLDLPAVGIAGAPNAGKSSLLNKLTGCERSIVSAQRKTTRDVLTGELSLKHCRCVLFDCAGLMAVAEDILDDLTQQAAIEALRNSSVVVFCVDLSKEDWSEDISINGLAEPQDLIPVATKSDLLPEQMLANRLDEMNKLFDVEFLPTSAVTGEGLEQLRDTIDKKLIELVLGRDSAGQVAERASAVALTTRHRQAVMEAIGNVSESINELKTGSDEVAAMLLRAAYQNICDIEQRHFDDEILQRIFSRFCIGK
jgi:tRNA modification GTPase